MRVDTRTAPRITYALIGGFLTGGALAGACSPVDGAGNCGTVGLVTLGLWLGIGALCAPSLEASSRLKLERPTPEELRAFARLPQGLPAGVTPVALAAEPESRPRNKE